MRVWIADIISWFRRFFMRGRTQSVQERERASAEESRGEIRTTLDHQRDGGSVDNLAIPSRSITDFPSAEPDQQVDRAVRKNVQPAALDSQATSSDASEVLEPEGVQSTIADDPPEKSEELGTPADREPGTIVPNAQHSPSRPAGDLPETQAPVTTNTNAVESDAVEETGGLLEPAGPIAEPDKDPTTVAVVGGAQSDYIPNSEVVPDEPARSDGEMTTASASPPKASRSQRSNRVAPAKRGGRPRGTGGLGGRVASALDARNAAPIRSSRPELVCWREGMAWVVGVEVPEELAEQDPRVIDREGNNLSEDHLHELRFRLIDPLGPVTVRWSDAASMEAERRFDTSDYRIFKVAKSGANGRCVARVTQGHYVVVAPKDLSRDETVGSIAPVAPETVIPEQAKILAHHLLVEGKEDDLVLDGAGHSRVEVRPTTATAYKLIGNMIEDAHTGAGPLFGREPPRFRVEGAAEPTLFVVGVEGPSPHPRSRLAAASFDELWDWLEDNNPGWFYVRAYDANDELLESLDFRYVQGLEAIEVDELSPLPGPQGHRPANVVFRVAPGTTVTPVDCPPEIISLDPTRAGRVALPPRPDAGRATWRLSSETGNGVEAVVHVPRIWWALTTSGNADEPHAWSDRVQMFTVHDLRPTSPKHLSVLLPEPGWADEVTVSFRGGSPRRLLVPRSEQVLHYALRNLAEIDTLQGADSTCDLLLSVRTPATEYGPIGVAVVQLPEIQPEKERAGRLDLSCLSAPRLMSKMTHLARTGTAPDRGAVKRLRKTWYRKVCHGTRRGGSTEPNEFVRQALALAAAWLEREPNRQLPSRLQRQAQLLYAQDPTAVATWQHWLRGIGPDSGRGR
jgi:hypothetical protein